MIKKQMNEWMKQKSIFQESVEHRPYFVVESLVVQVVNFDRLEILFGVKITFGNKEGLPEDQFLKLMRRVLWFWRRRSTWYHHRRLPNFSCWLWGSWQLVLWWVFRLWKMWVCSSSFCRAGWGLRGCFCLDKGIGTFFKKGLKVLEVLFNWIGVLHLTNWIILNITLNYLTPFIYIVRH